jgi:hypothetical protein
MQSTLTPHDTDPHDAFVIEPDVVLAARQASPDPVQELLSHLAHKAAGQQASSGISVRPQVSVARASVAPEAPVVAPMPAVDTAFRGAPIDVTDRPVVPDDRPGIAWWLKRAFVAFLFALCSAFAAAAWTHHGEAAKQMISSWLPPFVLAATSMIDKPATDNGAADKSPATAEQPGPAPAQAAAAADQAPGQAQPSPPAQPAIQHPDAAATAAATPAPPAPSPPTSPSPATQSMERDLATMGQQIEQLKASIEQLKAGQAQMSRELAKNSEPRNSESSPRPRASANPPRPVASIPPRPAPRRPRQAYLPPPAVITSSQPSYAVPPALPPLPPVTSQPMASQPMPLPEAATASDDGPVIRPPMPLR